MKREEVLGDFLADGIDVKTSLSFLKWHDANPVVWKLFEQKALALVKSGKKRWGAKAIMQVIRYERAEKEGGQFDDYAVNNNYPAYYARVFALKHPQFKDFFEFREIKGLKEAA